jgi:hypothetical protein
MVDCAAHFPPTYELNSPSDGPPPQLRMIPVSKKAITTISLSELAQNSSCHIVASSLGATQL